MIQAEYDLDSLTLSVHGHAGYAQRGKDIVCAGVSTLVYTLCGVCGVDFGEKIQVANEHRAVFEAVIYGLRMIAESFPENLNLVPYRKKIICDIIPS